ncbi:acyl-CoA dehydrogenase [Sinomonas cellulolyticus]|uniref:Acyl-CoA dehydrogenase n=1 Tax=Sinomonas cellulolyticus TaxID=2801916 RepID=A0ABS1K447_9MICC|nr:MULTISPECIES: acyl-CoA dehydrogenase family protein [Sinomonas]MBL0706426.1 acyl-CoA dehydrogenase [Sinomonas cellulolyticus]GHG44554.1 acyl-CoA dehydrogenase [Sinomonas sp. KCTC 49339]
MVSLGSPRGLPADAPGESRAGAGFEQAAREAAAEWPEHALEFARTLGTAAPFPGEGRTRELWELLAELGAADLSVARVVEPHLDALAILRQAGLGPPEAGSVWGVFAAEAPGARLEVRRTGDGWQLLGTKPWCSLAGALSHAVVTAHTGPTTRRAFAVALGQPGITVREGGWHALGLPGIPSGPVEFDAVPAEPVGPDGWYLERPGFAWGGIGVAAVWHGGALGVARRLWAAASERTPDQLALAHFGSADLALGAAHAVLAAAAGAVDSGQAEAEAGARLALRVRGTVAAAAEHVLTIVDHALGPAPLAFEAEHAQRVADLRLYLRQHHAERDAAALGRALLEAGEQPW